MSLLKYFMSNLPSYISLSSTYLLSIYKHSREPIHKRKYKYFIYTTNDIKPSKSPREGCHKTYQYEDMVLKLILVFGYKLKLLLSLVSFIFPFVLLYKNSLRFLIFLKAYSKGVHSSFNSTDYLPVKTLNKVNRK